MSMIPLGDKDYSDGRTKQSFKDETDINKILRKAQKAGTLSHLQRHGAVYADFSDVPDLLTAHNRIKQGQEMFSELPSEVKKEFGNDMFAFFEYVNDPANAGNLAEKLPELAQPGRQRPSVRRSAATEANPAMRSAEPEVVAEATTGSPEAGGSPPDTSSTT